MRFFKTPKLFRAYFPRAIWELSQRASNTIYLTFDDGPYPETTPALLALLEKEDVKATFFCLGKQVEQHPDLYATVLQQEHSVGNHTYSHLDGWKTTTKKYLEDVKWAERHISSNLFRPPYGHMRRTQYRKLENAGFKIVLWSVMAYDFDNNLSAEVIIEKMTRSVKNGDIIVFHDQPKSIDLLKKVLPFCIHHWKKKGYSFAVIQE